MHPRKPPQTLPARNPAAAEDSAVRLLVEHRCRPGRVLQQVMSSVAALAVAGWAVAEAAVFTGLGAQDGAINTVAISAAMAVLVAALASSIAGFAFSALAGGALAHLAIEPLQAVRLIVVCSLAIQSYAVWKLRTTIQLCALWPMLAAGCATTPVGVWLLLRSDARIYAAGLGVFLAAYGICMLFGRRHSRAAVRVTAGRDAIAGALGGLAGGLAGFPGSFVTVWCSMRGGDKFDQRAIYQPYILSMQVVALVCLQTETSASLRAAEEALAFVPFALLGAFAGLRLFYRLTAVQFRLVLSSLLVIAGAALMARTL